MDKFCILLSTYFYDARHVYVVDTGRSTDHSVLRHSNVSCLRDLTTTLNFVSECTRNATTKSEAPTFFVTNAPGTYDAYHKLLVYCFPWIQIICRVPVMGRDYKSQPVTVSSEDLRCCDCFILDFTNPEDEVSSSDKASVFHNFDEIPKTDPSSLQWYATKAATVCSRCGWTGGKAGSPLSFETGDSNFHVLTYPYQIFTGDPLKNRTRFLNTSDNFGDREGFEKALVKHVARKFNFTLRETTMSIHAIHGLYPDHDAHEENSTVVSKLLTRDYHMVFGDVTIEATRSLYGDFSYPFDIDYLTAVSKVTENRRSFAALADISCMVSHICLSLILALYFSRRRTLRSRGPFGITVDNAISLILRPVYPHGHIFRVKSSGFIRKSVSTLHGLCALVITAVIAGVTLTILSKKTFSGVFDSETEVMEALSSPAARVYLSTHLRDFFLNSDDEFMERILAKDESCPHSVDNCLDLCIDSKSSTCLNFGEGVILTESLSRKDAHQKMYICPSLGFNILQGFLFNKGCFLARNFSREINRAAAMHLIARFKLNAGVQRHVHKKEINSVFKTVSLENFQELWIIYFYVWSAAIMTLVIEYCLLSCRNCRRLSLQSLLACIVNSVQVIGYYVSHSVCRWYFRMLIIINESKGRSARIVPQAGGMD